MPSRRGRDRIPRNVAERLAHGGDQHAVDLRNLDVVDDVAGGRRAPVARSHAARRRRARARGSRRARRPRRRRHRRRCGCWGCHLGMRREAVGRESLVDGSSRQACRGGARRPPEVPTSKTGNLCRENRRNPPALRVLEMHSVGGLEGGDGRRRVDTCICCSCACAAADASDRGGAHPPARVDAAAGDGDAPRSHRCVRGGDDRRRRRLGRLPTGHGRGVDGGHSGGLVRRRCAVPPPARHSHPAHRDHPGAQASVRRDVGRLRAEQLPHARHDHRASSK